MRNSNFALRLQPSLLEELRSMSEAEGVSVNQLINVAIAEKPAQLRTTKWFSERIAAYDPEAGAALIRDLKRGGGVKPRAGDEILPARKKRQRRAD